MKMNTKAQICPSPSLLGIKHSLSLYPFLLHDTFLAVLHHLVRGVIGMPSLQVSPSMITPLSQRVYPYKTPSLKQLYFPGHPNPAPLESIPLHALPTLARYHWLNPLPSESSFFIYFFFFSFLVILTPPCLDH